MNKISSKKGQKKRLLDKVFEKLKSDDTFICTELLRLGRNTTRKHSCL